jgi:long-chain acyl-CoA synthetase
VLPEDFTEEGGHLTPSLKLKRAAIVRDYEREIAKLYER